MNFLDCCAWRTNEVPFQQKTATVTCCHHEINAATGSTGATLRPSGYLRRMNGKYVLIFLSTSIRKRNTTSGWEKVRLFFSAQAECLPFMTMLKYADVAFSQTSTKKLTSNFDIRLYERVRGNFGPQLLYPYFPFWTWDIGVGRHWQGGMPPWPWNSFILTIEATKNRGTEDVTD